MSKLVKVSLVALVAALLSGACIDARPSRIQSYIEDIVINYNSTDESWLCDRLLCHAEATGCRISRFNSLHPSILITDNQCYHQSLPGHTYHENYSYTQVMLIPMDIDIEIDSFVGVVTDVNYGYSNSSQSLNGTVAVADWPGVQQRMRDIIWQALVN